MGVSHLTHVLVFQHLTHGSRTYHICKYDSQRNTFSSRPISEGSRASFPNGRQKKSVEIALPISFDIHSQNFRTEPSEIYPLQFRQWYDTPARAVKGGLSFLMKQFDIGLRYRIMANITYVKSDKIDRAFKCASI